MIDKQKRPHDIELTRLLIGVLMNILIGSHDGLMSKQSSERTEREM